MHVTVLSSLLRRFLFRIYLFSHKKEALQSGFTATEVDLEADVGVQKHSCYFIREKGNYWGCAVERNLVDKLRRCR